MAFTIHYEGHAIASFGGAADEGTEAERARVGASIRALPLEPAEKEAMWGLWSCVDALVTGHEDMYSDPETAMEAVLDDIKACNFRHVIPGDPDAFEDVIKFVCGHKAKLRLTVSL